MNDNAVLEARKPLEVPVIIVKCTSMSLSDARWLVRQLLAARYPVDPVESPSTAPEEVASSDVLSGDLKGEADCYLAEFTEGSELVNRASIRGDYERICEACSVVSESYPALVAVLSS